jgi:hypothetical protein
VPVRFCLHKGQSFPWCQVFRKKIVFALWAEAKRSQPMRGFEHLVKREINRANHQMRKGLNIREPNQPVRLTLPMMLGKAGLDAFLQSWNEVRQSIKKDDPIRVILFMFSLFL